MKFLTFLTFVLAAAVLFSEFQKEKRNTASSGDSVSSSTARPLASSAPTPYARSFAGSKSPAAPALPLATRGGTPPSPPDVLSSTLALVREKLSVVTNYGIDSASTSTTSLSPRTWRRSDLRIARGVVTDKSDSSLSLNCSDWIVSSVHGYSYAGDGLGMDPIYANLVETHEQFQFGRLMTMDRGTLRQSMSVYDRSTWTINSYLSGPVRVTGYPTDTVSKGKGIKIVVVPDGPGSPAGSDASIPTYTASFTLVD